MAKTLSGTGKHDVNDVTRIPYTIGLAPNAAMKLRQAIKRAQALGMARDESDALMAFVDAWLSGPGRRIR